MRSIREEPFAYERVEVIRGANSTLFGISDAGAYYFTAGNDNGRSEAAVRLDAAYSYDVTKDTRLAINIHDLLDAKHVVGRGSADYYNPRRTVSASLRHRG